VKTASGDPDVANMAEKRLLELKVQLDQAEDALMWPTLVETARNAIAGLEELVRDFGTDEEKERAGGMRIQVEDLIQAKLVNPLQKKVEQVEALSSKILFSQPSFWVSLFENAIENQSKMRDHDAANRLIEQGKQYQANGNFEGLKAVVRELWDLLPNEIVQAARRGYGSTVTK
jgi:molecular chaperone DnaK